MGNLRSKRLSPIIAVLAASVGFLAFQNCAQPNSGGGDTPVDPIVGPKTAPSLSIKPINIATLMVLRVM